MKNLVKVPYVPKKALKRPMTYLKEALSKRFTDEEWAKEKKRE
jgi:hypothetical protein